MAVQEMLMVKPGISLDSIVQYANVIQDVCKDYNVTHPTFNPDVAGELVFHQDTFPGVYRFDMSDFALGQMCAKIGVPAKYIKKCFSTGRIDLASENMNSWLNEHDGSFLIRCWEDKVRGVLSQRFMTFDAPEILESVSNVAKDSMGDWSVAGFVLNPFRLHVRLISQQRFPIGGEDLFPGIMIDSSDVGRSTLSVNMFIFKQICTNGLSVSKLDFELFKQRHIGISLPEFQEDFRKAVAKIPDAISSSLDFLRGAISSSPKILIPDEDSELYDGFVKQVQHDTTLGDESARKVISLMQEKYTPTVWGLVNSVTEVAQDFTLERRLELERIAGDLLAA